jgi:hypothetical protein
VSIPLWIDWSAPVLVYALALLKGSAPERLVGGLCAIGWAYGNIFHPYWLGEKLTWQLTKDIVLLVFVVGLAVCYDRWWLLVAGMTAVLWVATDVAEIIAPVHPWAFGTAIWTWGWIFLAALATGTWFSWRKGPRRQVRHTT